MTLARWSLRRNNGANTDYRKTCRNRAASVRQFPSIFFSKFAAENPPSIRQTAPHPGHSELSLPRSLWFPCQACYREDHPWGDATVKGGGKRQWLRRCLLPQAPEAVVTGWLTGRLQAYN
ncbi:uncharacterized protein CCOS01_03554 [Colletotrichum costaricense]|uniref:Uncharacterized protein n=1 Tax=Colletotrichum costaricense TaxID=1209916 RepID=A0AAJ0E418_9PEZI|nr:uncharacterized protein CCOS01_03554 [Colletotrichum costaricense]KAI3534342.1 hypothetical protein CSPX01_12111 [Colletotrichum filicis]KAK1534802.1 hypothetical protein CCOS01_03554 [Colletotrichum costaricense]